ncbi:F0F1 ATP synthase subunit A [Eisenibacter elegans]|uniref:F0F1 ATP synthase subunit A n=1 Tax=Eisenibacter elegans TaxID=997 RepID=UPI00042A222A|nr:F0F1 ATP synthase subunit A [Eisenibacter elegans]
MKYILRNFLTITALAFWLGSTFAIAGGGSSDEKKPFNAGDMIMHHIADSHEWHFATLGHTHISIPLPVILYSPSQGLIFFMSGAMHHATVVEAPKHEATEGAEDAHHTTHNIKMIKVGDKTVYFDDHEHFSLGYDAKKHHLSHSAEHKVYDFSITKNVASMFISVALLMFVFLSVAAGYKKNAGKAPRGIQSFFEPIILFVRDDIAKTNIGEKHYERFTPYLLTIFFFIWFNNVLGLIPGGANLTGNITITLLLALLTFFVTNFSAKKDYWMHILWTPGVPWWLKTVLPIMPIVELIGIFTKPFSLMIRLFANITAGHIIILSLFSLIFIFESLAVGVVSMLFAMFMNFLELFVALLQAYVFTLLTAMYFGSAVEEHHHEEHHEGAHH